MVVVLAAVAALVGAAELALVVELVQEPEAVLAQAAEVELAVEVLGQEVGQEVGRELELVVEAKHLESGSLHLHCYEEAVLAVAAQFPEEPAEGRAAVALGLA